MCQPCYFYIVPHHWYLNHFEWTYTLDMNILLQSSNYLIEGYVKWIFYVKKIVILSYDHSMFKCILVTPHNFKYSNWKINKHGVSNFDSNKIYIIKFKVAWICAIIGVEKRFPYVIPPKQYLVWHICNENFKHLINFELIVLINSTYFAKKKVFIRIAKRYQFSTFMDQNPSIMCIRK